MQSLLSDRHAFGAGLSSLTFLNVSNSLSKSATDEDLSNICCLTELRSLDISSTSVGYVGANSLSQLTCLTELNLFHTSRLRSSCLRFLTALPLVYLGCDFTVAEVALVNTQLSMAALRGRRRRDARLWEIRTSDGRHCNS